MLLTRYENEGVLHVALISRGNEKLAKELLERQAEILTSLYGDGLELSDEELESSMNTSGQSEPEAEGGENSSTKPDDSHDKEPEETSGEE